MLLRVRKAMNLRVRQLLMPLKSRRLSRSPGERMVDPAASTMIHDDRTMHDQIHLAPNSRLDVRTRMSYRSPLKSPTSITFPHVYRFIISLNRHVHIANLEVSLGKRALQARIVHRNSLGCRSIAVTYKMFPKLRISQGLVAIV